MLCNVNKYIKKNILEQFRQEALKYREKKKYEKLRRIQEEREFLLKQEEKYKIDEELQKKEKHKKQEQEINQYNLMLTKLNSKGPLSDRYLTNPTPKRNYNIKKPFIRFNINEIEKNKSLQKRERDIIARKDIIGKYLTDENNTEELFTDLRIEKEKSKRFYKEISDLQYLEYQKNNMNLFGTEDPLIVERKKRKLLSNDPFSHNIKYNYWKSNLPNNPILNPENNVRYNKYLFQEEMDCNNYNSMIMNKKIKNKNNYSVNANKNYNLKYNIKIKVPNNVNNNNNKYSDELLNTFNNREIYPYSRNDIELKNKFFNINNDYYPYKINNYNHKEEINYNNNSYRPKICKRKLLRQAISSSFLV